MLCGTYESKAHLKTRLAQPLISFGRFKVREDMECVFGTFVL